MYIEAHGYSHDAQTGVPKLVLKEQNHASGKKVLEFDFVVAPSEVLKRKKLHWEIKQVYDVEQFPLVPNWIKVNAARNADIVLVEEKEWQD